ncbi:MAG: OmpA family protein [Candidatus Eisenbacteria bacterium]|jgi:chemotaxis protein MotB|nr:OmpA family protein [Candidatus Eisenbacteria bacterium]MBP8137558.1 OmpA family protein [Candidatus Eisenbacteria bacterium]
MSANKEREVPVRIIYKKKGHGHGHHGGAWKVAFADFMTAMFAMFLVLWLINQSSDVKSAVAGYFQDPLGRSDEFGSSIVPGEGAQASVVRPMRQTDVTDLRSNKMQVMSRLQEELASAPELKGVMDKIEIKLTDEGLQIQLLEDSTGVFFESGSASPSWRGRGVLAILGQELGQLPNPILIAGYTDARPYRRADGYTNWELSADRANTARRILQLNGVGEHQVEQIRGFADRDLRTPDDPYGAGNRRVSITMKFDGAALPPDSTDTAAEPPRGTFE